MATTDPRGATCRGQVAVQQRRVANIGKWSYSAALSELEEYF